MERRRVRPWTDFKYLARGPNMERCRVRPWTNFKYLARGPNMERCRVRPWTNFKYLAQGPNMERCRVRPWTNFKYLAWGPNMESLPMANTHNLQPLSTSTSFPALLSSSSVGYEWVDETLLPPAPVGTTRASLASISLWPVPLLSGNVLKTLGVVFPLPVFETDMLRALGIAPSQLHPSAWASLRAFRFICPSLFLYYHIVHVSKKVSWVHLIPHLDCPLLIEYTILTTHFCHEFVKLRVIENASFISDKRPRTPKEFVLRGSAEDNSRPWVQGYAQK
ncbi:hypothetical protein CR513_57653, partial [Mucuna pruriens]